MYKSAEQYLGLNKKMANSYSAPRTLLTTDTLLKITEKFTPDLPKKELQIKWNTKEYVNISDPKVWGPPFWFSLHSSAANYPLNASNIVKERMIGRILALPIEIPCASCRPHAGAFIEANKHKLRDICSERDSLFDFYVDFHNKVNQRYNKSIMSYKDARDLWMNGIKISTMSYE